MSNDPIKTETPIVESSKVTESNSDQKKSVENNAVEKDKRKDYDVQATDTKVKPSQK